VTSVVDVQVSLPSAVVLAAVGGDLQRPIETGWVVQGPYVAEFERKFAEFTGVKHAVAVSNCTTALHVAMTIMGVGPGDEVIVPAFTCAKPSIAC
jgi:dTDP-4-amino-4,6-dideoxygalactose transaminase